MSESPLPATTRSFVLELGFDALSRPLANGSLEGAQDLFPLQLALSDRSQRIGAAAAPALFTRFLYLPASNDGDTLQIRFVDITGISVTGSSQPSGATLDSFQMFTYDPETGDPVEPFASLLGGTPVSAGGSGTNYGAALLGSSQPMASYGFKTLGQSAYPTWRLESGATFMFARVGPVEVSFSLQATLAGGERREFVVDPMLIVSPDERP